VQLSSKKKEAIKINFCIKEVAEFNFYRFKCV